MTLLPFPFSERLTAITSSPDSGVNDPYDTETQQFDEAVKWAGDADAYTEVKTYRDTRNASIDYATELRVYVPLRLADIELDDRLHLSESGELVVRRLLSGVGEEYDPISPYLVCVAEAVDGGGS